MSSSIRNCGSAWRTARLLPSHTGLGASKSERRLRRPRSGACRPKVRKLSPLDAPLDRYTYRYTYRHGYRYTYRMRHLLTPRLAAMVITFGALQGSRSGGYEGGHFRDAVIAELERRNLRAGGERREGGAMLEAVGGRE